MCFLKKEEERERRRRKPKALVSPLSRVLETDPKYLTLLVYKTPWFSLFTKIKY
jgi:hypothetical protein